MKIHTKYNPPSHEGVDCSSEPSLTQQHFKKETDINEMLRKFNCTGELPTKEGAFYGDFSDSLSYQTALDALNATNESFLSLPAAVRDRVGNNPAVLLDLVADPNSHAELQRLGLIEVVTVPPLDVTVTTDTKQPQEAKQ